MGEMVSTRPRLLVALRGRDLVPGRIAARLPELSWGYLSATPPEEQAEAEAMLIGSLSREFGQFDATNVPKLAFIQSIYTGVDWMPFDLFPPTVRIAGNVGGYAPFVSEHAVTLALAASRDLRGAMRMVEEGRLRPPPEHRMLHGRTAVILGYGEIGRAISTRLQAFGMRVIGLNRTGRMAPGCDAMYEAERLKEALSVGDFVFEARPLTTRTVRSIGATELEAMPENAVFVNVGRAGTVDEEALFRHLQSHPRFRAAIDVWWEEGFAEGRLTSRFPFASLPNFVGTPHSAASGPGVEAYALDRALTNLARFFRGEPPLYVVDRVECDLRGRSRAP
ncbi:MAG TPA: 2-hydroxyacid dehydrogenase [Thermoplasmata archaeon]|nr:2-hydroxyacid dehydrogenase [Thermoplasmata archaeon]